MELASLWVYKLIKYPDDRIKMMDIQIFSRAYFALLFRWHECISTSHINGDFSLLKIYYRFHGKSKKARQLKAWNDSFRIADFRYFWKKRYTPSSPPWSVCSTKNDFIPYFWIMHRIWLRSYFSFSFRDQLLLSIIF